MSRNQPKTETTTKKAFRMKNGEHLWLSCRVEIGRLTKRRVYLLEDKVGHLYAEATNEKGVKVTAKARETFGSNNNTLQELIKFLEQFRRIYDAKHPKP